MLVDWTCLRLDACELQACYKHGICGLCELYRMHGVDIPWFAGGRQVESSTAGCDQRACEMLVDWTCLRLDACEVQAWYMVPYALCIVCIVPYAWCRFPWLAGRRQVQSSTAGYDQRACEMLVDWTCLRFDACEVQAPVDGGLNHLQLCAPL